MIKKKLGKVLFGWNETALKGKGWWYVMGKGDSFSRAASRKEASSLGLPKQNETTPKDVEKSKYYYDIGTTGRAAGKPVKRRLRTGSGYEEADITGQKSFAQMASERMMAGEGLGASMKGAIGDKLKAKATRIKRKFDPMNLLSKLPGVGKLAATAYGKARGRSASDISYFTGVHAPEEMEQDSPDSGDNTMSKSKGGKGEKSSKVAGTEKMVGILKDIHKTLSDKFEEDKKIREVEDAFKEEQKTENERRHKELIDAILKGMKPKESKAKKEKKETSLFDTIKSMFMNKILPILKQFGGGLMSILSKLGGVLGPLALVVGGVVGGAKVIDKGYEAVTGKSSDFYNKSFDEKTTPQDIQDKIKKEQLAGTFDESSAMGKNKAKGMADYEKQLKQTGKVKNAFGQDITVQAKKELEDYKAVKKFKETDPYQQYKREVEGRDYKGKKRPTFEEWKASKGITPAGSTATKVPEQVSQKQSYELIGGQPVISGQPLNETQMAAANMSLQLGGKLKPETQKSYDLAKQVESQASPLGQRVNASTQENLNLKGTGVESTSPTIINKTTNVVNNGGINGGGGSASVRNDEPVLTRLQYQSVRPV